MAGLKDIGLFFLGAGVLIFTLMGLHFYITRVLPASEKTGVIYTFCTLDQNGGIVKLHNGGDLPITDVKVYVDNRQVCEYNGIPSRSDEICTFSGPAKTYKVIFRYGSGIRQRAGGCVGTRIRKVVPIAD